MGSRRRVKTKTLCDPVASATPQAADDEVSEPVYRFYPEHLWRASAVFAFVFVILIALSIFANIPREAVAGTLVDSYLPRPEWYYMWLFQLLTYFSGKWEAVGSLAIPFLGVTILFLLPFINRPKRLGTLNRPLPLAAGATAIVGIVYLTFMGFAGARPYGETVVVPDRPLTASESRGLSSVRQSAVRVLPPNRRPGRTSRRAGFVE